MSARLDGSTVPRPVARRPARESAPVQRLAPPLLPLPDLPGDVAIADWDDLLSMVKARLKRTALAMPAVAPDPLQASVLECVAALDQLQTTLNHEFARRHAAQDALPDRAFVRERYHAALTTAGAGALLIVQIDDFAEVTRSHGQAFSDALFQIVGARLVRAVRRGDLVSPIGVEGFAVLLEKVSSGDRLSPLTCKLFDAVSAPLTIEKVRVVLHPSIGVAAFPANGRNFEQLFTNAQAAVQRARRNQYGYAFFDRFADG